ncbi:MAG: ORF6N domain-containing protein [Verrucomicrobia bacterium]|nr:ORF6N domain-containing protein [Verrucomicrobiota bacterium]
MTSKPASFYETQVTAHLRPLRGQAVILDSDLAWFLGIEPAEIIAAVEDNPEAFPEDFVFRLSRAELVELQRRNPCLTDGGLSAKHGRLAFTTHGAGMLLVVIKDEKFSLAAIPVFRAFGNYWKVSEDYLTTKPLVNRKS